MVLAPARLDMWRLIVKALTGKAQLKIKLKN